MVNELENHNSNPSLLHGDLWGGNYMFLTDGSPALFDPAPFYGDREFDLESVYYFSLIDFNNCLPLSYNIFSSSCREINSVDSNSSANIVTT